MVEPDLIADVITLRSMRYEDVRGVVRALVPVYKRYFEEGTILRKDLIEVIRSSHGIKSEDKRKILAVLDRKLTPGLSSYA